jgi:hypothetical protein
MYADQLFRFPWRLGLRHQKLQTLSLGEVPLSVNQISNVGVIKI